MRYTSQTVTFVESRSQQVSCKVNDLKGIWTMESSLRTIREIIQVSRSELKEAACDRLTSEAMNSSLSLE